MEIKPLQYTCCPRSQQVMAITSFSKKAKLSISFIEANKTIFSGRLESDFSVKTYRESCKNKDRISILLGCFAFRLTYCQPLGVPLFCYAIILK